MDLMNQELKSKEEEYLKGKSENERVIDKLRQ
jgi:hypothetical protein